MKVGSEPAGTPASSCCASCCGIREFEIAAVTSEQRAGRAGRRGVPVAARSHRTCASRRCDPAALAGRVELAFTALPHAASAPAVHALREAGIAGGRPLGRLPAARPRRPTSTWYGEHAGARAAARGRLRPARAAPRGAAARAARRRAGLLSDLGAAAARAAPARGSGASAAASTSTASRACRAPGASSRRTTCSPSSTATATPTRPGFAHRHAPGDRAGGDRASPAAPVRVTLRAASAADGARHRDLASTCGRGPARRAPRARAALDAAYARRAASCACCPRASCRASQPCAAATSATSRFVDDARNDTWILLSTLDNLVQGRARARPCSART